MDRGLRTGVEEGNINFFLSLRALSRVLYAGNTSGSASHPSQTEIESWCSCAFPLRSGGGPIDREGCQRIPTAKKR